MLIHVEVFTVPLTFPKPPLDTDNELAQYHTDVADGKFFVIGRVDFYPEGKPVVNNVPVNRWTKGDGSNKGRRYLYKSKKGTNAAELYAEVLENLAATLREFEAEFSNEN